MFRLEDLPDDAIRRIYDLINRQERRICVDSLNDTECEIWPESCISRDYPHLRFSAHTCMLAATSAKYRRIVAERCRFLDIGGYFGLQTQRVETMRLSYNFKDKHLESLHVVHMVHIHTLILCNMQNISSAGWDMLARHTPRVKKVKLAMSVCIQDADLDIVGDHWLEVQEWCLRDCWRISDNGICALFKNRAVFSKAESIDLARVNVTDKAICAITAQCPDLQHISLEYCHEVTEDSISTLQKRPIKELLVTNASQQMSRAIIDLTFLTHLSLCGINVRDEDVIQLRHLPLTHLDLSFTSVTSEGLQSIANEHLQSVALRSSLIDDYGVTYLAMNCRKLTSIDVSETLISNTSLQQMADNLHNLRRVYLSGCDVTLAALLHLAHKQPIHVLNTARTCVATPAHIEELLTVRPGMKIQTF